MRLKIVSFLMAILFSVSVLASPPVLEQKAVSKKYSFSYLTEVFIASRFVWPIAGTFVLAVMSLNTMDRVHRLRHLTRDQQLMEAYRFRQIALGSFAASLALIGGFCVVNRGALALLFADDEVKFEN